LTAAQCDELEHAMRDAAAALPPGPPEKEALLWMASSFSELGKLKG
jgi:hypothetical protein